MTYLEALYGSQYAEISGRGGDVSKARFNGNLFLSAFAIICVFIVLSVLFLLGGLVITQEDLGTMSGKSAGKILAIPLMALIYFAITKTVGSEESYNKHVRGYLQRPETEKANANKMLLTRFFIALGILMVLMFIPLFD